MLLAAVSTDGILTQQLRSIRNLYLLASPDTAAGAGILARHLAVAGSLHALSPGIAAAALRAQPFLEAPHVSGMLPDACCGKVSQFSNEG